MISLDKVSKHTTKNLMHKNSSHQTGPSPAQHKTTAKQIIPIITKPAILTRPKVFPRSCLPSKPQLEMPSLPRINAPTGLKELFLEYDEFDQVNCCECSTTKIQKKIVKTHSKPLAKTPIKANQEKKPIVFKSSQTMIKKLKWSDFSGQIPKSSPWLAYTIWSYSHSLKAVPTRQPNNVRIQLQVKCGLSPKSWVRSPHDDLLSHEQGHYDIACLCMLTFKKRVVEQEFNINTYRDDIARIYKETVKEFRAQQILYDEETQHYCDEQEQERWDKQIQEDLSVMKRYEFMDVTRG